MPTRMLRLFGALAFVAGLAVFFVGYEANPSDKIGFVTVFLPVGSVFLLASALLYGFAHALELLERIERNTGRRP